MADWSEVEAFVNEYVEYVRSGESNDDRRSKYEGYIMEAAVEAVHGPDIWNELNDLMEINV